MAGEVRHGIVYIAPDPDRTGGFVAYWDNEHPPKLLEQAPPFASADDAVRWGRARADRVVIRLGSDETSVYSAGEEPLTRSTLSDQLLPEWPPAQR